jgi:lipopolysaccharide export system ATP-binding protein
MHRLTLQSLTKSYDGRKVVDDVSLEVKSGEVVGLLGPNGAGKTSTFFMVLGLLEPDGGQVYLDGEDISLLPIYRLAELRIAHLAHQKASALSGGERRRVEITRALVTAPHFIILDEPFAGIDPLAVTDIQNIIRDLKDRNLGVLISDHNVREALGVCDRAYILNEGVILEEGPPEKLVQSEVAKRIYLGETFKL